MHSSGPVLAQVAAMAKLVASLDHEVFHSRIGAVGRPVRSAPVVIPVDAVKAFAVGAFEPALHGREADANAAGDRALGGAASDGGDHVTALLGGSRFLRMGSSSVGVFDQDSDRQLLALT